MVQQVSLRLMSRKARLTRLALASLAAVFCLAAVAPAALAKDKGKTAEDVAAKLAEPLSKEAIRDLVSRLDDAAVRKLLIDHLDRAALPAAKKPKGAEGMEQSTSETFARLRDRVTEVAASTADVPAALDAVARRITEPDDPSLLWLVAGGFLAMLAGGALAELALGYAMRGARRRYEEMPTEGLAASAVNFGLRTGIGIAQLAAFTAGAVVVFLALWQGRESTRLVVVVGFSAVLGVRLFALLARRLLEPRAARWRVLPFDDRAARILFGGTVWLASLFAFLRASTLLLGHFGAPENVLLLIGIVGSTLFAAVFVNIAWKVRADVAGLIRGPGQPGALRRLLAELWPVLATAYVVVVYLSTVHDRLLDSREPSNAPILSIALLLVLPLVDMLLCRILAAAMRRPAATAGDQAASEATSLGATFEPVLQRAIHIVVLVSGFLALVNLWGLDLFAAAERGLGGRITSAIFGIAITTLLAWILWEVARTAIDQRMQAEAAPEGSDRPLSRLGTLLPLLRALLLATILVIAVLSVLAALGINIVPLLAGASVLGVAIGFGSQTLVRDVVSGAFFLMDDAFRVGEYIEVGDAKGTVEKIGVRAVMLRHHRGPLNVLPYGEIKRLRNTSRDWMIMIMEFRLTYDTNLMKVKKIIKKIGEDIAADPELGKDILAPLKSQGVIATDDSALIVRAKFMANPSGGGAYMARRESYARIIKAFAAEGIKFADRRVTVNVTHGTSEEAAIAAAAGAAAAAAAAEPRKP